MAIKIDRFEVKSDINNIVEIIDHSVDKAVVSVGVHKTSKENKELAKRLIPVIEEDFEE